MAYLSNIMKSTLLCEVTSPRIRVVQRSITLLYKLATGAVVGRALRDVQIDSSLATIDVMLADIPEDAWQRQHTIYVDTSVTPHVVRECMTPTWPPSKSSIVANGVDSTVLTGIPVGAEIRISDKSGSAILTADGTALTITSLIADTIEIVVFHKHYRVQVFTVGAI